MLVPSASTRQHAHRSEEFAGEPIRDPLVKTSGRFQDTTMHEDVTDLMSKYEPSLGGRTVVARRDERSANGDGFEAP